MLDIESSQLKAFSRKLSMNKQTLVGKLAIARHCLVGMSAFQAQEQRFDLDPVKRLKSILIV